MVYLRGLGIAVYLVASIPDMLSFMVAPSKLLMLLSSVEPLLVGLLTYFLLPQESALFTFQQSTGTVLCIAGIFGYTIFSVSAGTIFGLEEFANEALSAQHASSEGFLFAAWERLVMYLAIALPCLICFAWKARQSYNEMESSGIARFPLSFPITVALSLALQHLALVMLGLSMTASDAVHKSPISPILLCVVAVVCMVCGSFHVCRGITQAPPHIFATIYYTMGALLQMFQSTVIFREYHDVPTNKAFAAISCALVSLFGLAQLHLSQGRVKKIRYAGGMFGRVSGVDVSSLGSIEPHAFSEELPEAKASRKPPVWVTAWRFLGRA
jgi:hypothetical protein